MTLEEKLIKVEAFYSQLDQDLLVYQNKSSLSCIAGCSNCCRSPNIEATILEMLPLAFQVYKENKAEAFYDSLQENTSSLCALYTPEKSAILKGGCSSYPHRALICRLFGFSYSRDKIGNPSLISCKDIKETHAEAYKKTIEEIKNGDEVPMAANYQSQLTAIDPNLSQQLYPINKAIIQALEIVMTHYYYTDALDNEVKNAS